LIRVLKPVVAGFALAYLVTAFVDRPAPVNFQPSNPYASGQSKIVEPQVELVVEKNIMKLGSPLSAIREKGAPESNPLAVLEGRDNGAAGQETTAVPATVSAENGDAVVAGNGTAEVLGTVEAPVASQVVPQGGPPDAAVEVEGQ
jgi:hypothetical protein